MTSKTADPRSLDELRQLDPDTFVPVLGCTAGQMLADIKADEERYTSSQPKPMPPCPSWCAHAPGHGYESVEKDDVTLVRYHESHPSGDDVTIVQEEKNCRGDVALLSVKLTIWGTGDSEDLSGTKARALAADLLARAEQLDEITGAQR